MPIDRKARILDVKSWGDYRLLSIGSASVAGTARPGQFVMVKVSAHPYPLLRRPLSIHDARDGGLDLFFQVAGKGTEILAGRRPGDGLDIIGPLGRGFSVSSVRGGKKAVCVGGGRGIAPLFFLARELQAAGASVTVFYGGRSLKDVPLRAKFEASGFRTLVSTDDGSHGFKGLVTELLEAELRKEPFDVLFGCGPDPMMKTAAGLAAAVGIPAEFSLESVMGCGIGACWGCVHRIKTGENPEWTKICEDGPVFPGERIVWEE